MAAAASATASFDWKDVSTFKDLQQNVILFLRGKHTTSPWHGTPVDPETVPLLEDLITLNQGGFITTESQPDEYTKKDIQRAYVSGLLDTRIHSLEFLMDTLETRPSICAITYRYKDGDVNILNHPIGNPNADSTQYILTKSIKNNVETAYTVLQFQYIPDSASMILDNLDNEALRGEIMEYCLYVTFINNTDPTETSPKDTFLPSLLQALAIPTREGGGRTKRRSKTYRKKGRKHTRRLRKI
jgi:hypothetical protein